MEVRRCWEPALQRFLNLVSEEKMEMMKSWAWFHVEYGEPILKEKSLDSFESY